MSATTAIQLAFNVYDALVLRPMKTYGAISVSLRAHRQVGTVQDDPFDEWTHDVLNSSNVSERTYRAGRLKSPDITLINDSTKTILGLEVKKLEANRNGADPRGLTLDYNSTVPCGLTTINYDSRQIQIPLYYYFALLQKNRVICTVICDGNFLSCDFEFHKESKVSNTSTYGHGSYGEASIRHRKMYLFPNPLNSNLEIFSQKHVLVVSKEVEREAEAYAKKNNLPIRKAIRESLDGTQKEFILLYQSTANLSQADTFRNIFHQCREREPQERSPYVVTIPSR